MSDNTKPVHTAIKKFPVKDNELLIGNVPVSRLAARVGSTPFYAYDRKLIVEQLDLLRMHLPSTVHIHYAMKANPMPAVVQHLANLVDGIDVASHKEMLVALDTGMRPASISFAGPGKNDAELSSAVAAGVIINIESDRELSAIIAAGEKLDIQPKVAVRVNPDFELKGSSMKMGGGPKQFGVDAEKVPEMLKRIDAANLEFQGFHIFSGSQNLKADSIVEAQTKTLELAYRLAKHTSATIKMVNIGGGFGIPYFPGDTPLDLATIGRKLDEHMFDFNTKLPQATMVIELGRYLVGEAGVYVCRILEKKVSRDHTYLIVDGGMHHHLAASGNFGQVIRKNYPVVVGNQMSETKKEIVSVVGPLCTPLDLLADKMELSHAEVGDLIVVHQSGAYGYTASPLGFLSHPTPKEILV